VNNITPEQARQAIEADAQQRARDFALAVDAASKQYGYTLEAQVVISPRGTNAQVIVVPLANWPSGN
jgi:hypothetical protein